MGPLLTYFGWVAVDDPDIPVALVPLDVNFLGVHAQNLVLGDVELKVNNFKKFNNVAKELLRDTLASAVDG